MKQTVIHSIELSCGGCSDLEVCKEEAIAVAMEHKCTVVFKHNMRRYEVSYNELTYCVKLSELK